MSWICSTFGKFRNWTFSSSLLNFLAIRISLRSIRTQIRYAQLTIFYFRPNHLLKYIIIKSLLPFGKRLFIRKRRDCLESFALNVSTDFASKNFVLFAKVLRTLLTPRSNSGKASPCGVLISLPRLKQKSWYSLVSALLFKIRKRRDSNSRCRLPHTTP